MRLLCLLCLAWAAAAQPTTTRCTFTIVGDSSSLESAKVACSGPAPVSLQGGRQLQRFAPSFTGVDFTVDAALGNSAALVLRNASLAIADSRFASLGSPNAAWPALTLVSSNVTITNSSFSGCAAAMAGAVVSNCSTISVTGSAFSGNEGLVSGAVYASGGLSNCSTGFSLSVTDSEFVSNRALLPASASTDRRLGGALSVRSARDVQLSNCTFMGNAALAGGALWADAGTQRVAARGCRFANNSAALSGGAIALQGADGGGNQARVERCVFEGNLAGAGRQADANWTNDRNDYGGNFQNGTLAVGLLRERFIDSNSRGVYLYEWFGGGAVCLYSVGSAIADSLFVGNSGLNQAHGGAVLQIYSPNTTVTNTTFAGNTAGLGGALAQVHSTDTSITGTRFLNNSAVQAGGAVRLALGDNATLTNCTLAGNRAVDRFAFTVDGFFVRGPKGGALDSWYSNFAVDACAFDNNSAVFDRSAPANAGTPGGGQGGAVFQVGKRARLANSRFTNNTADGGGALLDIFNDACLVSNNTFINNTAVGGPGGAWTRGYGFAERQLSSGNTFIGNRASSNGGAVNCESSSATVQVNQTFINNSAGFGGGALNLEGGGCLRIQQCRFVNNSASFAGAVWVRSPSDQLNSCAGAWSLVTAPLALPLQDSGFPFSGDYRAWNLFVLESNFTGNSADGDGGALLFDSIGVGGDAGAAVFDNLILSGNAAGARGGALFLRTAGAACATDGLARSCLVLLSRSQLDNNHAGLHGGALALFGGTSSGPLHARLTNFVNNSADADGGAMYAGDSATLWMFSSSLASNRADGDGGGLACVGCRSLLSSSIVMDSNTCQGRGGALYSEAVPEVVVQYATCTANTAAAGGCLAIDAAYVPGVAVVDASRFARNAALDDGEQPASYAGLAGAGGAVSVVGTSLAITSSNLSANEAGTLGGAVFLVNSALYTVGSSQAATQPGNPLLYENLPPRAFAQSNLSALDFRQVASALYPNTAALLRQRDAAGSPWAIANTTFDGNTASQAASAIFAEERASVVASCGSATSHGSLRQSPSFFAPYSYLSAEQADDSSVPALLDGTDAGAADCILPPPAVPSNVTQQVTTSLQATFGPARLHLMGGDAAGIQAPVLQDYEAGAPMLLGGEPLRVALLDAAGQLVTWYVPNRLVSVTMADSADGAPGQLIGVQNAFALDGVAHFAGLSLRATLGRSVVLNFTMPQYQQVAPTSLTVQVRGCRAGESAAADGLSCTPCALNTFSVAPGGAPCTVCPAAAICIGGAALLPQPGYWHASAASAAIQTCPNRGACRGSSGNSSIDALFGCQLCRNAEPGCLQLPLAGGGSNTTGACNLTTLDFLDPTGYLYQQCAEGYSGRLCGRCTTSDPVTGRHYARTREFTCRECPSAAAVWVAHLTGLAGTVALMLWSALTTLQDAQGGWLPGTRASDLLRVLTTYLQYLFILTHSSTSAPVSARLAASVGAWAAGAGLASNIAAPIECGLRRSASAPLAVQHFFLDIAVIAFEIAAVTGIVAFLARSGRLRTLGMKPAAALEPAASADIEQRPGAPLRQSAGSLADSTSESRPEATQLQPLTWRVAAATTALNSLMFLFPVIAMVLLDVFSCYKVQQGSQAPRHGYWSADVDLPCYSGWHLAATLVAAPLALAACCGLPIATAAVLGRRRPQLEEPRTKARLGFLYRQFRPSCFYWGSLIQLQTLVLLVIVVFTHALSDLQRSLLVLLWLSIIILAHMTVRPYQSPDQARLVSLALAGLLLALAVVMQFATPAGTPGAASEGAQLAVGWLVAAFQFCVVALLLRAILRASQRDGLLRQLWEALARCNPWGWLAVARSGGVRQREDGPPYVVSQQLAERPDIKG